MIKKIINHFEYRKKIKLLKMIAVNKLTDFVINKDTYIIGFNKLLITIANNDNAEELQKLVNDYITTLDVTIKANKVMNEEKQS